jgi:hypothetical protein
MHTLPLSTSGFSGMNRVIIIVFLALLSLPLVGLFLTEPEGYSKSGGRELASLPGIPKNSEEWNDYPSALKAYVADHFGGRNWLRDRDARLKRAIGVSTKPQIVMVGKDDWLFHLEVLGLDIAGFEAETVQPAAQYYAHADEIVTASGAPFVIAMIPHKIQIYPEYAPADFLLGSSEYYQDALADLIQVSTKIDYLDLLPSQLEEKFALFAAGATVAFKHDTHWNMYGANAAQFAIAQRLDRYVEITPRKVPLDQFRLKSSAEKVFPDDPLVDAFFTYENRLASLLGLRERSTEPYPLPDFLLDLEVKLIKKNRLRLLRSAGAPQLRALIVHDSGSIGLAPYFSRYFSESLYWWTSVPSLLDFQQMVTLYKPDVVIWQTSQNSIASRGFQSALPVRLREYEAVANEYVKSINWQNVYNWADSERLALDPVADEKAEVVTATRNLPNESVPPRFVLILPEHVSQSISGKRVKVSVSGQLRSGEMIQGFGVSFSSVERKCLCIRRLLVDSEKSLSHLLFLIPDTKVEQDRIEVFPQAGALLEDLILHSIKIYTE